MTERESQSAERAGLEQRQRGNFVEAGEYYTSAAYDCFSEWPPSRRGITISRGAYFLLFAATCYRLGGRLDRAQNRCQQGVLVSNELLDRTEDRDGVAAYDKVRYAAWHEYVGDFQLVGALDDGADAYQQAKRVYLDGGDPPLAHREQEHMWLVDFFEQVVYNGGHGGEDWKAFLREATLSDWVERKEERFPVALENLDSQTEWG
jgi:hypothetical protein